VINKNRALCISDPSITVATHSRLQKPIYMLPTLTKGTDVLIFETNSTFKDDRQLYSFIKEIIDEASESEEKTERLFIPQFVVRHKNFTQPDYKSKSGSVYSLKTSLKLSMSGKEDKATLIMKPKKNDGIIENDFCVVIVDEEAEEKAKIPVACFRVGKECWV